MTRRSSEELHPRLESEVHRLMFKWFFAARGPAAALLVLIFALNVAAVWVIAHTALFFATVFVVVVTTFRMAALLTVAELNDSPRVQLSIREDPLRFVLCVGPWCILISVVLMVWMSMKSASESIEFFSLANIVLFLLGMGMIFAIQVFTEYCFVHDPKQLHRDARRKSVPLGWGDVYLMIKER